VTRKKEPTFAEARERLLQILREVESDAGDVDQLVARVKEAAELYRFCNDRLAVARTQVTQVVADLAAAEQGLGQAAARASADLDDEGDATGGTGQGRDDDGATDEDEDEDESARPNRGGAGRLPF